LKEAEGYFRRGLKLLENATDKYIICSHLSGLADVLYKTGRLSKAIKHYQKALKLGEEFKRERKHLRGTRRALPLLQKAKELRQSLV